MELLPEIIPTAEPFYLSGESRIGCLLIHGFTGSPKEMRWLGEYLQQKSISVLAPRLCGHATKISDMRRSNWEDWYLSVLDSYHLIRHQVKYLFVIGLSMGGVLASIAAANLTVDGLVTLATPTSIPEKDWRLNFIRPISLIIKNIKKGKPDWKNPEAEKDHVHYPLQPTRSIAELKDLFVLMDSSLPRIKVPSLHIHSTADKSVPFSHLDQIMLLNQTGDKASFIVHNSAHVVTREPDRQAIFERIYEFILDHTKR